MPFLSPNQQRQSTEGTDTALTVSLILRSNQRSMDWQQFRIGSSSSVALCRRFTSRSRCWISTTATPRYVRWTARQRSAMVLSFRFIANCSSYLCILFTATEWWVAGVVVWSKVQTCIWPSWCHCHSLSLASVKSRWVLTFWYQLPRVVPYKGPLNGCVCVCVYCYKTAGL